MTRLAVKSVLIFVVFAILAHLTVSQPLQGSSLTSGEVHRPGIFYGTLKLQPIGDGINMKVLDAYSYSDSSGHVLSAQPGFVMDGASIPRVLWTVMGSPFTGKYIGAAVVHDVGCAGHKYTWQITHRMFYDAMIDLGVNEHQAKLMYYGVLFGGPKWKEVAITANTKAELSTKIAERGAISIIETSGTTGTSDATGKERFKARIVVPSPTQTLTKQQLMEFDKKLTRSEKENTPLSLEEIENLANPEQNP
jgi:hypothetical protein